MVSEMPAWRNCSSDVTGPFASRYSIIRRALISPMPGSFSNWAAVAVLTLILPIAAWAGSVGRGLGEGRSGRGVALGRAVGSGLGVAEGLAEGSGLGVADGRGVGSGRGVAVARGVDAPRAAAVARRAG